MISTYTRKEGLAFLAEQWGYYFRAPDLHIIKDKAETSFPMGLSIKLCSFSVAIFEPLLIEIHRQDKL